MVSVCRAVVSLTQSRSHAYWGGRGSKWYPAVAQSSDPHSHYRAHDAAACSNASPRVSSSDPAMYPAVLGRSINPRRRSDERAVCDDDTPTSAGDDRTYTAAPRDDRSILRI